MTRNLPQMNQPFPKELANGYNGAGIHFNITEEQMKEKYRDVSGSDNISKRPTEEIIPLTEERLNVSKKKNL
jgi:hypothetical protein